MDELTCPRCGAVFAPEASGGLCPNCSYNTRTLIAKLRLTDKEVLAIILLLVSSLFLMRNLFFAGIAVALAWSTFAQKAGIGWHRPPIGLNLEAREPKRASIPISRPAIPNEWKSLASLPRPRVIAMPAAAKGQMILSAVVFFAVAGFVLASDWNQFKNLLKHPQDSFGLLWLLLFVYMGVSCARDWFAAWEILRDGELTTGILTDWREGRGGASISYQFWTDSGQRFERQGKVISKEELAAKEDPLKVFYLPQNPTKSVALACTPLRIRIS